MAVSRRTFLAHLAGLFSAASMTGLRKRVEDLGRPILLPPLPRP